MIIRFVAHLLALVVATAALPGIYMSSKQPSSDLAAMVGVAVIFALVNSAVKPLFRRFGHEPLALVLLGVALLVVNAGLLQLTSWLCGLLHIPWHVDSWLTALLGGFIVAFVSFLVNSLFGRRGEEHR